MFEKVLIANRGEIAIRVARTLQEMGIGSVAVYSELDRDAPHVREADEAFLLGPATPAESYLNIEKILEVAARPAPRRSIPATASSPRTPPSRPPARRPRSPSSARRPRRSRRWARRPAPRELMQKAGVPIVPGATSPVEGRRRRRRSRPRRSATRSPARRPAAAAARASASRSTRRASPDAFEGAAREGEKFFSDPTVYLERYLEDPRHVEVQVLADAKGNVIHLGERDCSVQRRHQKLIEESPGPKVDEEMRERIGKIAIDAAAAVGYRSAGTVEGLQVGDDYFFLEMNTRVQVEHCVTEMVTGIDIVREQVRIAAGEQLSISQEDVELRGHAIECRINAEAAHKNFAPAPGKIAAYREPAGPGVRVDSGVEAGSEVTPMYDPMVAKLIVWDIDREHATARMLRALGEYEVGGHHHPDPLPQGPARDQAVGERRDLPRPGRATEVAEGAGAPRRPPRPPSRRARTAGEDRPRLHGRGRRQALRRQGDRRRAPRRRRRRGGRRAPALKQPAEARAAGGGGGAASGRRPGLAAAGQRLQGPGRGGPGGLRGRLVCVIEAMKMENEITAHKDGKITQLPPRRAPPSTPATCSRRSSSRRDRATSRRASPRPRGGS